MAKMLHIGVIGPGLVGAELVNQLLAHVPNVNATLRVRLHVSAIANSKKMVLFSKNETPRSDWKDQIESGASIDLKAFADHLTGLSGHGHGVIVDCTSSASVASNYVNWLETGIHIVTPNKKAFSEDFAVYEKMLELQKATRVHCFHEATVGAGLPIISTLQTLVRTGDEIVRIEGIFSGTLSFIFNTFSAPSGPSARPFSDIVAEAKAKGYTEPDPRDDLNGLDVARKVVILSRVAQQKLTLESLPVENIVPEALRGIPSPEEFMAQLPAYDEHFAKLNAEAAAQGSVLRYVGVVEPNGRSCVEMRRYPKSHPFASLSGSDNVIAFTTKRYPNPLIVQGAGAGAAVTAAGVFGDILQLANIVL
eukprot:Colp12_sorted_trinity150504_noHs@33570